MFYSDFDGTYCPEKHYKMHKQVRNPDMVNYCETMEKFFKQTHNTLNFHITTCRTLGEFEAIYWLLKIRVYRLPLPQSVIVKNDRNFTNFCRLVNKSIFSFRILSMFFRRI